MSWCLSSHRPGTLALGDNRGLLYNRRLCRGTLMRVRPAVCGGVPCSGNCWVHTWPWGLALRGRASWTHWRSHGLIRRPMRRPIRGASRARLVHRILGASESVLVVSGAGLPRWSNQSSLIRGTRRTVSRREVLMCRWRGRVTWPPCRVPWSTRITCRISRVSDLGRV